MKNRDELFKYFIGMFEQEIEPTNERGLILEAVNALGDCYAHALGTLAVTDAQLSGYHIKTCVKHHLKAVEDRCNKVIEGLI